VNVRRLTGLLGAEVTGLDTSNITPFEYEELLGAILDHKVVVIPRQHLTPAEQVALSRRFGPYGPVPFVEPIAEHPEVIRVLKEADEGPAFNFGGAWHTDFSFQPEPPWLTLLYAVDVPACGGDTVWADQAAAYEALSVEARSAYAALTAVHTARDAYSPKMAPLHAGLRHMDIRCDDEANETHEHPLVTAHPQTGRPVLAFNNAYVREVIGAEVGDDEAAVRAELQRHTTDIRFTFRHRWAPGDLVIWDNRTTQHIALNDYAGSRRELHRTTVAGPIPTAFTP
jgi:taurine dioxygenase